MARQFKRFFELVIGVQGGEAVSIKELQVVFNVQKSIVGYPNLLKCHIYNLAESTAQKINEEYNTIQLFAGYESEIFLQNKNDGLIFTGEIRNIITYREGADLITTIYAGDGERTINESTYSKTFSEGVNFKEIFTDLGNSLKEKFKDLSIGRIDIDEIKLGSLSLNGSIKKILDKLSEDVNANWSIQDGEFVVIKKDDFISGQYIPVVQINQNTGMIGLPAITEIGADCLSLLNAKIKPHGLIQISSETFLNNLSNLQFRNTTERNLGNGIFRVNKVIHYGETRGNNWYSQVMGQSRGVTFNA